MSYKYVFIAPYEEMSDMAREVARELDMSDWTFDVGYDDEGLQKAQRYAEQGAKLIVSRNMTARAISRHLDIPVIDLSASPYDIVNGLEASRMWGKKIGVMGPAELVYGCHRLGSPMGLDVTEMIINDRVQIPAAVAEAKRSGIEVILGGQNESRCAAENGLKSVLLHTGKSTVAATMKKAVQLQNLQYSEKMRAAQMRTILDHSYEGILAADEHGSIILINLTAQSMLGVSREAVGMPIRQVAPMLDEEVLKPEEGGHTGGIYTINDIRILLHARRVLAEGEPAGVVLTLQHVKDIVAMESRLRREIVMKGHVASVTFSDITTCSKSMRSLIDQAKHYALTDSTVLITGETGTGKEMFAQSIHNASRRKLGPFVAINCASIPENLLESELFGYEEGAFTGARRSGKKGYFEIADNGTLFLDEIGEIPLKMQANLLRVLQEKQIMRIGGDRMIPINVRIIAATHRDLQKATKEERFRLDLFYRLNILRLVIPPLRSRPADIPLLVSTLIRTVSRRLDLAAVDVPQEVMRLFQSYAWPGNVRELENAIERLCIVCDGSSVSMEQLREVLVEIPIEESKHGVHETVIRANERDLIVDTLFSVQFRRAEAAKKLGISTTTLWRKMKEFQIDISNLK